MNTVRKSKLNTLLSARPSGTVLCSSWLVARGYSPDLQKQYRRSQWFDSIGTGALIRHGDQVDCLGGIHALQTQLGLSVHPAAETALSLQGKAHYLKLSTGKAWLFGGRDENLPLWFKKRDWGLDIAYRRTGFLPPGLGLVDLEHKGFRIKVSGAARAVMECLYLAPRFQPLPEVFELMEGLNNLAPATVQELLEGCTSVKVKRLFLYLADRAGHAWPGYIDLSRIDLGTGKRAIVSHGVYVPEYRITVPGELGPAA